MSNINVFENSSDLYEEWFEENNHILDSEVAAIKCLLPPAGEGIEIGVGTGIFASRLGINYGVEPAEKMGAKARAKGINVIKGFAEDLPIEDEKYGYALMVTVDCFLEDVLKAFQEVWRILAANGYFIIALLDRKTPLGEIYEQHKKSNEFYQTAVFHSAEEIEQFLELAGFKVREKKQTVFAFGNKPQEIRDGVGQGVFAVIKAQKQI